MQAHSIAVNVLSPSAPVITPGNLVAAAGETNNRPARRFAEATLRVALADPQAGEWATPVERRCLAPGARSPGWLR